MGSNKRPRRPATTALSEAGEADDFAGVQRRKLAGAAEHRRSVNNETRLDTVLNGAATEMALVDARHAGRHATLAPSRCLMARARRSGAIPSGT